MLTQSVYTARGYLLRDERFVQLHHPRHMRGCLDNRWRVRAESVSAADGHMLRFGWLVYDDDARQLRRDVDERRELHAGESMSAAERIVLRRERLLHTNASVGVFGRVGDRECVQPEPLSAPIWRVLRCGGWMHVRGRECVCRIVDDWRHMFSQSVRSGDRSCADFQKRFRTWHCDQRSHWDCLRRDLLVCVCHRYGRDAGCHPQRGLGFPWVGWWAVLGYGNVLVCGRGAGERGRRV